jgi:hypothetical protein
MKTLIVHLINNPQPFRVQVQDRSETLQEIIGEIMTVGLFLGPNEWYSPWSILKLEMEETLVSLEKNIR